MFLDVDVRVFVLDMLVMFEESCVRLAYKTVKLANQVCGFVDLADGEGARVKLSPHEASRDLSFWSLAKRSVPYPKTDADQEKQHNDIPLNHRRLAASAVMMVRLGGARRSQDRHERMCSS